MGRARVYSPTGPTVSSYGGNAVETRKPPSYKISKPYVPPTPRPALTIPPYRGNPKPHPQPKAHYVPTDKVSPPTPHSYSNQEPPGYGNKESKRPAPVPQPNPGYGNAGHPQPALGYETGTRPQPQQGYGTDPEPKPQHGSYGVVPQPQPKNGYGTAPQPSTGYGGTHEVPRQGPKNTSPTGHGQPDSGYGSKKRPAPHPQPLNSYGPVPQPNPGYGGTHEVPRQGPKNTSPTNHRQPETGYGNQQRPAPRPQPPNGYGSAPQPSPGYGGSQNVPRQGPRNTSPTGHQQPDTGYGNQKRPAPQPAPTNSAGSNKKDGQAVVSGGTIPNPYDA